MGKLLSAEEEAELQLLWGARATLQGKRLEQLCRLIIQLLRRCHAPELLSLRETSDLMDTRTRYIHDFLLVKVLDTERFRDNSPLDAAGSLVTYFRNFLRNAIEKEALRKADSLDEETDALPNEDSHTGPEEHGPEECGCNASLAEGQWLGKARSFVQGIEKRYQVLLLSYCADEPVFTVAKRYNIASAAHHAGKLGITKKHGGLPPAFGETLIGRWMMQTLQIDFTPDSINEFRHAIESLCAASFELREALEASLDDA